MLKILHLAPQNYAGVPYSFYEMHNTVGDFSRLITYHKNPHSFPEDICLNIPLPNNNLVKKIRRKKVKEIEERPVVIAPVFKPSLIQKLYFSFNDLLKERRITEAIDNYNLNDFDIIHYDAGLDFYRFPKQAIKWKNMGKKIVCCYYGSDLRIRGIIKELDEISDLNITSEYDHLALKKDLRYLYYPYSIDELPDLKNQQNEIPIIVHSPTNRKYKGTDLIIRVIERIKSERKVEFKLCENMSREDVLEIKSKSDICIDQVGGTMGGTGYGKAGLETLGMGIPTVTNMSKEYEKWIPENPFSVANNENELYSVLSELLDSKELRYKMGKAGKDWVLKYHSYTSVDKSLKELYKEKNII